LVVGQTLSIALLVFDPATVPAYLILATQSHDNPSVVPSKIKVSKFGIPSLELQKEFSIAAPPVHLDADLNGLFSISCGKLVLVGQKKDSNCCLLSLIDLETGIGSTQLFPDFAHLAFIDSRSLVFGITVKGWVQTKKLKDLETAIGMYGMGKSVFDGRGGDKWVLEGWKRVIYIPPSFLPTWESGIAVHEKGELAYVGDFGKRLVRISFRW
jgi:hypothetical protein